MSQTKRFECVLGISDLGASFPREKEPRGKVSSDTSSWDQLDLMHLVSSWPLLIDASFEQDKQTAKHP